MDIEAREANYMDSLGGRLAGILLPLANTHVEAQRGYAQTVAEMASQPVPMKIVMRFRGEEKVLEIEMPMFLLTSLRPIDYGEGTKVSTRFSVSARDSSSTNVGSKVEAGMQAGWGPVSASFKAEVTVGHEQQRESSCESTVDVDVFVITREPPELVSKLGDIFINFCKTLVEGEVKRMLAESEDVDALPAPEAAPADAAE